MVYIIADDLTGANDTGIQYRKNGWYSATQVRFDSVGLSDLEEKCDVIAINADSRHLPQEEAYRLNYRIAGELVRRAPRYLYKKIDSLLRGNPARELEAVMDAAGLEVCLVAPGYPDNSRTLEEGIVYLNGIPVADANIILRDKLSRGMSVLPVRVTHRGPGAILQFMDAQRAKGISVFLCDTTVPSDLDILARAGAGLENVLYCGAAGFAKSLSSIDSPGRPVSTPATVTGHVLVVIGTRNSETAAQVARMQSKWGTPVVVANVNDLFVGDGHAARSCVDKVCSFFEAGNPAVALMLDSLFGREPAEISDEFEARQLSSTLGCIARDVLGRSRVGALILSGGDTAVEVCLSNSITNLSLDDEVSEGIPACTAIDSCGRPLRMVTKSGGFGCPDTLADTLEYLLPRMKRN